MNKPKYQINDVIYGWKIQRVSYSNTWQTYCYVMTKRNKKLGCDEQFLDNYLMYK